MRNRKRAYRPQTCTICHQPLTQAAVGRVRHTCSDRCRQIKRRQDYQTWKDPRREQQAWRRAEQAVRRLEKRLGGAGALDIPVIPGDIYFTLRKRVLIRYARGEDVPLCRVCGMPYIIDSHRWYPTCKGACARVYGKQQRAVLEGLERYRGEYDPRVDVRQRLGLPVRACQQCGKPFCADNARRMYCSKRCANNAWYARHPKRMCTVCGETFRGKGKRCSDRCAGRLRLRRGG